MILIKLIACLRDKGARPKLNVVSSSSPESNSESQSSIPNLVSQVVILSATFSASVFPLATGQFETLVPFPLDGWLAPNVFPWEFLPY